MACAPLGESLAAIAGVPPVGPAPAGEPDPQPASAKAPSAAIKRDVGNITLRATQDFPRIMDTHCPESRNLVFKRAPPTLIPTIGGLQKRGNGKSRPGAPYLVFNLRTHGGFAARAPDNWPQIAHRRPPAVI